MDQICAIKGCQKQNLPATSFHGIPTQPEKIRNDWIQFIRLARTESAWLPKTRTAICCHHFKANLIYDRGSRKALVKGAVPTIAIHTESLEQGSLEMQIDQPDDVSSRDVHLDAKIPDIAQSQCCVNCQSLLETNVSIDRASHAKSIKLVFEHRLHFNGVKLTESEIAEFLRPGLCSNCDSLLRTLFESYSKFMDSMQCDSPVHNLLHNSAVSSNVYPPPFTPILESAGTSTRADAMKRKTPETPTLMNAITPKRLRFEVEHTYAQKTTPRTHARKLTTRLSNTQVKLQAANRRANRRKQRVLNLTRLIKSMKKYLNEDKVDDITNGYSAVLKSLISVSKNIKEAKNRHGIRYTENMKKFAVTLHFYSPRAYRFLRNHLTLPHESSLAAWMSTSDCGPGFNKEIIRRLGEARLKAKNQSMDDTVLQLDEMAIKKDTPWCQKKHKYVGTVDYGTGCELANSPLASNALVVLLAGLSGGWKIPIGYVFTNKVNGTVQHNLMLKAIQLISEHHFSIHAVVGDGNSPNVTMFRKFGVIEMPDSLKSNFDRIENCQQEIYAIYDVVHMIKLWRNMLHQYKMVYWRGNPIKWIYIESLEQLQDHELIRAANKLSPQHLHFENNKMKVRLAVQVFSSSVADAIDFCREDLGLVQFRGSEHTTKFIRRMDSAFDILNSRHPKQRGYKAVLNASNFNDRKEFLLETCEELVNMSTGERPSKKRGVPNLPAIPLWQSKRKRAVIGFIVSARSVISITQKILFRSESPMKYVLTYRFSQDLIELLFNKIRQRLGGNNNPNVLEFEHTMKRIWHQNLLKSTSTGNCIIQMEDTEIPGGLLPLRRPQRHSDDVVDFELSSLEFLTRTDINCTTEYSLFYSNCLAYVAGSVVKSLRDKLQCKSCVSGLFEIQLDPLPETLKKLIRRKNLGGLIYSSLSVYNIVLITDKVFRKYLATEQLFQTNNLDLKISHIVMLHFSGLTLFPALSSHFNDFDPIHDQNHEIVLIKAIVSQFLKIRLYDYGRKFRKVSNASTKRQMLSKEILFRNE